MTVGSDETGITPEERLHDALLNFTGCVGMAIEGICSYGLTIGASYVPFDPDPGDETDDCGPEDTPCSQLWVRVTDVTPVAISETFDGSQCAALLRLGLEVGVVRCIPIEEEGEAPKASDVMVAAMQSMSDMLLIQCGALSCEAWESINIGSWTPHGPLGGQYGGTWTFTVEL
jgi:hypothetical protein